MRRIFVAVPLLLLAFAAPASAHGPKHRGAHRTTRLHAALAPSAAGSAVAGRAKLVDGRKRDKLSLQVRGLDAGSTYTWELRQAAAAADACTGTAVDGFSLRALRVHRHGGAKAAGHARRFSADPTASYAIVVLDADGTVVACAPLGAKAGHGDAKPNQHGDDPAAGNDDQQGADDSQGEDDQQGADDQPDTGDASEPADQPDPSDDDPSDD